MALPPATHLLYLHGFRSSPQSAKARLTAEAVRTRHPAVTWCCPQLPPSPAEAAARIQQAVAGWPHERMAVVGSSLGGFYALWLAARTGCRAVLLNPAVHPARDLARHIGEHTAWHDPAERFFFRPEYIAELQALEAGPLPHPERCLAIIARGDELLDWQEMLTRCAGAHIQLLQGGDHALSDYPGLLDGVLDFLHLA